MSSLKHRKAKAKKKLEKRKSEFEKSKANHARYPSTKEWQSTTLSEADKDYNLICNEYKAKYSDLTSVIVTHAPVFFSSILKPRAIKSPETQIQQGKYEAIEKLLQKQEEAFQQYQQKRDQEFQDLMARNLELEKTVQQQSLSLNQRADDLNTALREILEKIPAIKKQLKDLEGKVALVTNSTQSLDVLVQEVALLKTDVEGTRPALQLQDAAIETCKSSQADLSRQLHNSDFVINANNEIIVRHEKNIEEFAKFQGKALNAFGQLETLVETVQVEKTSLSSVKADVDELKCRIKKVEDSSQQATAQQAGSVFCINSAEHTARALRHLYKAKGCREIIRYKRCQIQRTIRISGTYYRDAYHHCHGKAEFTID